MRKTEAAETIIAWAACQIGGGLPAQFSATESGAQWRRLADAFNKLGHPDAGARALARAQAVENYLANETQKIVETQREANKGRPWTTTMKRDTTLNTECERHDGTTYDIDADVVHDARGEPVVKLTEVRILNRSKRNAPIKKLEIESLDKASIEFFSAAVLKEYGEQLEIERLQNTEEM
jgi:hypothetical protein